MSYSVTTSTPAELHTEVAQPLLAAPVQTVVLNIDNAATDDATIAAFVATRKCMLLRGSYLQESNATAATSFVATLKQGSTDLTDDLDIKALGADTAADWDPVEGVVIEDGDIVDLVFNQTGGTVTAPDLVSVTLELLLLE